MTTPEIHRPLDNDERDLMIILAVGVTAHQNGVSEETAAAALDQLTLRNEVTLTATETEAVLATNGHPIVRAERDWLTYHAHFHDGPINIAEYYQ